MKQVQSINNTLSLIRTHIKWKQSLCFFFFFLHSIFVSLTVHPSIGLFDRDVVLKTLHWLSRDLRVEIRHCHCCHFRIMLLVSLFRRNLLHARLTITSGDRALSVRRPPFSIRALVEQCRHRYHKQLCRSIDIDHNEKMGKGYTRARRQLLHIELIKGEYSRYNLIIHNQIIYYS